MIAVKRSTPNMPRFEKLMCGASWLLFCILVAIVNRTPASGIALVAPEAAFQSTAFQCILILKIPFEKIIPWELSGLLAAHDTGHRPK